MYYEILFSLLLLLFAWHLAILPFIRILFSQKLGEYAEQALETEECEARDIVVTQIRSLNSSLSILDFGLIYRIHRFMQLNPRLVKDSGVNKTIVENCRNRELIEINRKASLCVLLCVSLNSGLIQTLIVMGYFLFKYHKCKWQKISTDLKSKLSIASLLDEEMVRLA